MSTNLPHVNFAKANLVLGYLLREADLSASVGENTVPVFKKTGEEFLFPQAVIDVLTSIGNDGKDAASTTKQEIVSYARAVLLGEGVSTAPVEPAEVTPDEESPVAEVAEVADEAEAPIPPPPSRAPAAPAPRPAVARPASPPPAAVRPAPAAPPRLTPPPTRPPSPVTQAPRTAPTATPVAAKPPVTTVAKAVDVKPVDADSDALTPLQTQQLQKAAPTVIFNLLAGADHFSKYDVLEGAADRRAKLKQLADEYSLTAQR